MTSREYNISTFGRINKHQTNKAERQGAKRTIREFEDKEQYHVNGFTAQPQFVFYEG